MAALGSGRLMAWTDDDSRDFLPRADILTPARCEVMRMIAGLTPASAKAFAIVELCCGGGDLAAHLLEAFPQANYLGLDGSDVMLAAAGERSAGYGERVRLRSFRLEDPGWRAELPRVRVIVSMLAIHHLDGAGKRQLFADLLPKLEPGGALLVFDLVLPSSAQARRVLADSWDDVIRRQGGERAYRRFEAEHYNIYRYPDPMDMPDPLFDQLVWLQDAGYRDVDCFWQQAGHALYGGYRPA